MSKPDWLNEVLDNLWATAYNRGLDYSDGVFYSLNDNNKVKAQAHKLISAQLIREQRKQLENISMLLADPGFTKQHLAKYLAEHTAALTNQLKKIEHEN